MQPNLKQYTNGSVTVFIPARAQELSERRLALELSDISSYDPELYAELLDALAAEYDMVYPGGVNASRLRDKAAHYRNAAAASGGTG